MTTTEAAKRLQKTKQGVQYLIRAGKLRARLVPSPRGSYWDISENEVRRHEAIAEKLSREGEGKR